MSVAGVIKGRLAVLAFFKDTWQTYACCTDVTLSMNSTELQDRTPGDGHWKSVVYQDNSYSIALGGVVIWDPTDTQWTDFDFVDNWLNNNHVQFRLTFIDTDSGAIKSFQGSVMISGHDLAYNSMNNVKGSLTLPGSGALKYFDGYIPCPAVLSTVTITGQTAADGIIHIAYTYTGTPTQIKYRIDGIGNYIIVAIDQAIAIPGLSVGAHTYELILGCQNGYDVDTSTTGSFSVTQALTCSAACTAIGTGFIGSMKVATPTFTGSPATFKWSVDGGSISVLTVGNVVPIGGFPVGAHSITITPTCANGVDGTPFTQAFTNTSSPTSSVINWSLFSLTATDNVLTILVNGIIVATITGSGTHTGNTTVPIGANVQARLNVNNLSGQNGTLTTVDNTTSTTLDTRSHAVPGLLIYTITANGDTFTFGGSIL